jgi:hypothetical protein
MTRDQRAVIEYLLAELAVHRELNAGKRLLFTDAQRRKLARAAKKLSRKTLASIASLVTPDTLLRWYRALLAAKHDGSALRGPGRPRTALDGADAAPRAVTRAPAVGACSSTEPGVVTAALSGPLAENPPSAVHPKTW